MQRYDNKTFGIDLRGSGSEGLKGSKNTTDGGGRREEIAVGTSNRGCICFVLTEKQAKTITCSNTDVGNEPSELVNSAWEIFQQNPRSIN